MDEVLITLVLILVIVAVLAALILPIVALVISIRSRNRINEHIAKLGAGATSAVSGATSKTTSSFSPSLRATIQELTERIEKLEAAMPGWSSPPQPSVDARLPEQTPAPATPPVAPIDQGPPLVVPVQASVAEVKSQPVSPSSGPTRKLQYEQIESIIGRRAVGWAAVLLILFAAAFFLKYAFDNRWIGELGRVAIGVSLGIGMTVVGFRYYKRGWRIFSQILTAGGIVLLYLSTYAAFGYYHLATQKAAFIYLAILVAEAAGLALLYNAPSIAIMALVGGFLAPILLHSDRDQYRSLFVYIVALDLGALALLKRWNGLTSLAFAGTHLLFWLWYVDKYHPQKLSAVMVFQTAVFLIFLLANLARRLFNRQQQHWATSLEELTLLLVNPFVFFATAYGLLDTNHHDWMGVFAISMALVYAGAAKILLDRSAATRGELLLLIGVALTFVTIAIPIQLQQNWITIAWSVEALLMLWAGLATRALRLRVFAYTLFGLALLRLVFWDTLGESRPMFTPVLNKYFLASLVVTVCLFGAAALFQRTSRGRRLEETVGSGERINEPAIGRVAFALVGIVALWFVMSVETHTFFAARAAATKLPEVSRHELWLGQMALSVLWSLYAGVLAAVGFVRRSASVRWASLGLFGLAVFKVMLVDIAELKQFYRIIVFFVLGMLLLVVAWGYHKAFQSRELSK
jgi:uncharacterized membrane protein